MRESLKPAGLVLLVLVVWSCAPGGPVAVDLHGTTMGTTWSVTVASDNPVDQPAVRRLVEDRLDLVDQLMSHYREDSEVSVFNAFESTAAFPVSAETFEVIRCALEIGELTGGALDITIGRLVSAWGFGPGDDQTRPPSDAEIDRSLRSTGFEHLTINAAGSTLTKDIADVRIDLSSVAKGYAVDLAAKALTEAGLDRHMVEVGGEIRVKGSNLDGRPWRLAIEEPRIEGRALYRVVALNSGGLATSGDYRNYRELEGQRASHIIDPRTGRPITHSLASVSVIDDSCARADGLATALMVLGPDQGYNLAEKLDIPALFLIRQNDGDLEERTTSAFQAPSTVK
jgi:thiamine biosynthesis lipoprotein